MKRDTARINSLTRMLHRNKLDALVCVHPENVLLAAGALPAAPFTVSVLTASGRVVVIAPWWRGAEVRSRSWADDVLVHNWLKGLEAVDPVASVLSLLKTVKRGRRLGSVGCDGSIGCLMPNASPSSCFTYQAIKAGLSLIFRKVVDVADDLCATRSIKTPREVRMLRKAHRVSREAARAFYQNARAGVREVDVAAEILRAVQRQAGQNGIRFTCCDPPQITSGPKRTRTANALTCPATAKKLKAGELVMLELGGCADGFWFDLTRTLVVGGKPSATQKRMAAAVREAIDMALGTYLVGGRTGAEMTDAAFEVLRRHGFGRGIVHGLGHGVGFAYHEDRPGIGPGASNEIEPGMVTSMEPGLYLPGVGGVRIEENVLWERDKVIVLSDFHNGLGKWSEENRQ